MSDYILIFTTASSKENADNIADILVSKGLAACVNKIDKVESVYKWKGEIVKDKELLLIIKTRKELFDTVKETIEKIHSYETPEIISVEIEKGSEKYLGWIDESLLK